MAARTPEEVLDDLLARYGRQELDRVRGLIGSETLRNAARLIVEQGEALIRIPHYWAVYYHDGRGGFEAPAGRFLVFFADPLDDPRLEGGYPVRASEFRRLTPDEFQDGLERNQENFELGLGPFMFVLRSVGPAGAHPFFDELSDGAAFRMDAVAAAELDDYVQEIVDDGLSDKSTARVKF